MPLFKSTREKRLWTWTIVVVATIFSTLFIGQPLANELRDQNLQAVFFVLGMLLVGSAILAHGIQDKPGKIEITVLLGIIAVYVMLFVRLGLPERSHLIEYSVLAIFIHKALVERIAQGQAIRIPGLLALVSAFLIGVLDECIQSILPHRVFDPQDILFNGIAVTAAVGSSALLTWIRQRIVLVKLKKEK